MRECRQSISDSDSGSDSDLETIGLAAAARASTATGTALRPHAARTSLTQQRVQTHAGRGSRSGAGESSSSQYVPATVQLLAVEASQRTSDAGAYSWHAAAAEFGAAESSLGIAANAASLGVRAVASDPIHADGPLHNANVVRGSIAIVQRGVCTFLEKARRVQVGWIFGHSTVGVALFDQHCCRILPPSMYCDCSFARTGSRRRWCHLREQ